MKKVLISLILTCAGSYSLADQQPYPSNGYNNDIAFHQGTVDGTIEARSPVQNLRDRFDLLAKFDHSSTDNNIDTDGVYQCAGQKSQELDGLDYDNVDFNLIISEEGRSARLFINFVEAVHSNGNVVVGSYEPINLNDLGCSNGNKGSWKVDKLSDTDQVYSVKVDYGCGDGNGWTTVYGVCSK